MTPHFWVLEGPPLLLFVFYSVFHPRLLVKVIATAIASKIDPPRKCQTADQRAALYSRYPGLFRWSVSNFGCLEYSSMEWYWQWCHRKNLTKEETVLCKIGNVETYLKGIFLPPVENAIARSCSLAKKGKCKALPVCRTILIYSSCGLLFCTKYHSY